MIYISFLWYILRKFAWTRFNIRNTKSFFLFCTEDFWKQWSNEVKLDLIFKWEVLFCASNPLYFAQKLMEEHNNNYSGDLYNSDDPFYKKLGIQSKNRQLTQRMKKLTHLKILTQLRKFLTHEVQLIQHLMMAQPAIGLRHYKNNTILRPDTSRC